MASLTQCLLENYYGFGGDNGRKSVASHEGFHRELCEEKSVAVDTNGNLNGDDSLVTGQTSEVTYYNSPLALSYIFLLFNKPRLL